MYVQTRERKQLFSPLSFSPLNIQMHPSLSFSWLHGERESGWEETVRPTWLSNPRPFCQKPRFPNIPSVPFLRPKCGFPSFPHIASPPPEIPFPPPSKKGTRMFLHFRSSSPTFMVPHVMHATVRRPDLAQVHSRIPTTVGREKRFENVRNSPARQSNVLPFCTVFERRPKRRGKATRC